MDLTINLVILFFSFITVFFFARQGAISYLKARENITLEIDFYTELLLGMESAGQNVCRPGQLTRSTRVQVWELYNNLRVQPSKENKGIVLHRKMLDKKQLLYQHSEEARVNVEILPFLGILGTLLGFAVPYLLNVSAGSKFVFQVTGIGFFLAASSTIWAVVALTYLKKRYEADVLSKFDYYEAQQKALEKIMISGDGFRILEDWLHTWPEAKDEKDNDEDSANKRLDNKKVRKS
jgi:uncharacterized membrane protein